ncbi:MAG: GntR family transcriptional regulator [Thermodesulfobacteriota bacterium]|jgi:DNA-binding GntR family transcriptional regulator
MNQLTIQSYPTIREQVYEYIRQAILSGGIAPGERLAEAKLSKDVGASRTPVREALHKLEMEKLVRSIPRVGYVVRQIAETEIKEICEIRFVLETLAAKWASTMISEKELARLGKIILLTERYIQRKNPQAVVKLDTEFHDILCKASKSERIKELSQSLRDQMLKFRMKGLCLPEFARRSNEGHQRILKAVKSKKKKRIESAVKFHLDRTQKDMTNLFSRPD